MSSSDDEGDNYSEEIEEQEQDGIDQEKRKEEIPKPTPLLVQYLNNNAPIGKIVRLLQKSYVAFREETDAPPIEDGTEEHEEGITFEQIQKQEDERIYSLGQLASMTDDKGRNLFQWAIDNNHFLLVELLSRFETRLTGLEQSGDAKLDQEMEIYDKWKQERGRIEEELVEKLKSEEEEEEETEEDDEEAESEPEPDFAQVTSEEMDVPVQRIRKVGDLGVYKGSYNDEGLKHGYGVSLYPNGDLYVGQYENGKKHGKGAYIYHTKKNKKNIVTAFYCGEWVDNLKHGRGYQVYPNNNRYFGYWKANVMEGKGKVTYLNGDSYIGEFKNGVKCGTGEYNFSQDKSRYIGQFNNKGIFSEGIWQCNGFVYKGPFNADGVPGSRHSDNNNDAIGTIEFHKSKLLQKGKFDQEHNFTVAGNLQDLNK